ncbi:MAG: MFS transporter [Planctomycetes bacterium]|nr:MFS transporter [Planctomycetota bacterium]
MTKTEKIKEFFGLKKSMAGLLAMVVLVGLGEKMAERFLPIYLLALGASPLIPGLLNGLDNLLSALYSFPGGWLSNKIGVKKSLLIFNLIALTGYAIVILIPHWIAVIAGSVFFLSWTALSLPATMELVSAVLPKNKRTMGVSMHSLVRRLPMAIGPVMGGGLIVLLGETTGIRAAFCCAFALGIVSLILQQKLITETPPGNKQTNGFIHTVRRMPAELKTLLVSDIFIRFCEQIPYAYVIIWCMKSPEGARINGFQFGILTAIEMATALLIYVPVAYLADKGTKKPYVVITFVNFTVFPIFLYFSRSYWMLIMAFIIRGFKEFGEPARKALIMDLAPEDAKAITFGAYYMIRDIVVSLAAFGSAFLWQASPRVNFFTAAFFGIAGLAVFAIGGKNQKKTTS